MFLKPTALSNHFANALSLIFSIVSSFGVYFLQKDLWFSILNLQKLAGFS